KWRPLTYYEGREPETEQEVDLAEAAEARRKRLEALFGGENGEGR
ncbi:MAG: hypothetical protein H5T97_02710, partial [Firmicutes bacterium]|nr:hypothetical protein [Bacillota bacterium]